MFGAAMTKAELIKALEEIPDDAIIVCGDEDGGLDSCDITFCKGGTKKIKEIIPCGWCGYPHGYWRDKKTVHCLQHSKTVQ